MGIPLLHGRAFTEQDDRGHLRGRDLSSFTDGERSMSGLNAIVVDEEFARRHWPNEDAIGKRVRLPWGEKGPTLTVVGVVGRVKLNHRSYPRSGRRAGADARAQKLAFRDQTVRSSDLPDGDRGARRSGFAGL